jgi:hypothetical protein
MPAIGNSIEKCWGTEKVRQGSPLLVFADDWGRHPSSCQHLIAQLLGRHEVYWVNTIGMRTPRLDLATSRRAWEKLRGWLSTTRSLSIDEKPRPRVVNPRMWPWFTSSWSRGFNKRLLAWQLGKLVKTLPDLPVVITTIPIVADLVGVLPARRWVYYCVDDFTEWPGCDQRSLRLMEDRLIRQADVLIAVSEALQLKIAAQGRTARLLTHGVDLEAWSPNDKPVAAIPDLAGLERPLVSFWGLLDQRMDVHFLRRLATDLTSGTIVLAGPELNADPGIYESRRIVRLGALALEQLPVLANESAVLIMPYADLPVTRAMQPLKLKEYLATRKPAVVRDLPAVRAWSDCLDLAATPEAFSHAVRRRLAEGLPAEQQRARTRLHQESWHKKARLFEDWALDVREPVNGSCAS